MSLAATCRRVALLLFLMSAPTLAAGLPRGDAKEAGFDPQKLGRIEAMLKEAVDRKQVAGGVALVARKGQTVYLTTVGMQDTDTGRPMSEGTIFRIASMTKPITSTAILMLCDEGKIKLTDPLSKYIPEFEHPRVLAGTESQETVPANREITIHDLLTHTSGLTYTFFNKPVIGQMYLRAGVSDGLVETMGTTGDNARRLAGLPLLIQPGSAWEYGLSTDVLGRVVEVVSGQTLSQFFEERICRPLQMPDTHFIVPKDARDRLAALYATTDNNTIRRVGAEPVRVGTLVYSSTYSTWDISHYYSGGAGLTSTIGDYARFLQMHLNRGQLDGARLLKPETVDLMTQNQIGTMPGSFPGHGDRFGYGFGVLSERGRENDVASVGTYSWGGIFYTYFWVDPSKELVCIMMTQVYPSDRLQLREQFKGIVYEALTGEGATAKP